MGRGAFLVQSHLSYVSCTIPMVEVPCLWNFSSLLLKFVFTIMLLVTFMLNVFTSPHHVCVFVLLTHWFFQTSKLLVVHLLVFVYSSFEFCYCSLSYVVLIKTLECFINKISLSIVVTQLFYVLTMLLMKLLCLIVVQLEPFIICPQ